VGTPLSFLWLDCCYGLWLWCVMSRSDSAPAPHGNGQGYYYLSYGGEIAINDLWMVHVARGGYAVARATVTGPEEDGDGRLLVGAAEPLGPPPTASAGFTTTVDCGFGTTVGETKITLRGSRVCSPSTIVRSVNGSVPARPMIAAHHARPQ
jgi:hypothetical protein